MIVKRIYLFTLITCLIYTSCGPPGPPEDVRQYLEAALDTIETHALTSRDVDWNTVREQVMTRSKMAQSTEETYDAIAFVLSSLNDHHSFLQKNDENISYPPPRDRPSSPYGSRNEIEYGIHDSLGISMGRIFIPQGIRGNPFAQRLHNTIADLNENELCGWIVDLRGNGGGNMWPMIAGAGVLMGSNPLGGSVDREKRVDQFSYLEGKAIFQDKDGTSTVAAQVDSIRIQEPLHQPVAYLIDRGTASSGEALAVVFKGRDRSRGFGEKTYGASTATAGFKMPDSLNIVLAVSTFQDRNGITYIDGVKPDVKIEIGSEMEDPDKDPVIKAAIEWLINQCQND